MGVSCHSHWLVGNTSFYANRSEIDSVTYFFFFEVSKYLLILELE